MKSILTDHGKILHWAGAHHLFPVRGKDAADIAFASHGELAGRTPIGWHQFFPPLRARAARSWRMTRRAPCRSSQAWTPSAPKNSIVL